MILLIYTTHATKADAQYCADYLLGLRLVACANVFPIESAYYWQGVIAHESEFVALFKTGCSLLPAVEAAITSIHSYDVPCIIAWQVQANNAYEQWVEAQVMLPA